MLSHSCFQFQQYSPLKYQLLLMDSQNTYPQVIIRSNCTATHSSQSLPSSSPVHIIPATAKQNAYDANVSQYFYSSIKNHESSQGNLQASLLGHELVGKTYQGQQNHFDAYLMKDGEQITMSLLRKITQCTQWRKDRAWGQNDGQYMTIAKLIDTQGALHDF